MFMKVSILLLVVVALVLLVPLVLTAIKKVNAAYREMNEQNHGEEHGEKARRDGLIKPEEFNDENKSG